MKLEEVRPAGVVSPFLKRIVPVWPVGMRDESAEIEDQGVRGRPSEPVIDETIEYAAESGF
jgi:hypothetical protein